MTGQYIFKRNDGSIVVLEPIGNVDEKYGDNLESVESLQKFKCSIIMPNGEVINHGEITGNIDENLLSEENYWNFVSEYYLDPERIERYSKNNGGYIGTVEPCPISEECPEGYCKQVTPEIMDRYANEQKSSYRNMHSFEREDGTTIELKDSYNMVASEQGYSLHEYDAKVKYADGRFFEGKLFGNFNQQELGISEYYDDKLNKEDTDFLKEEFLNPERLKSAMESQGGYIGIVNLYDHRKIRTLEETNKFATKGSTLDKEGKENDGIPITDINAHEQSNSSSYIGKHSNENFSELEDGYICKHGQKDSKGRLPELEKEQGELQKTYDDKKKEYEQLKDQVKGKNTYEQSK